MIPAASAWLGDEECGGLYYDKIIESAARAHDPFQKVIDGWLVRRLSPDPNPISISDWPIGTRRVQFAAQHGTGDGKRALRLIASS